MCGAGTQCSSGDIAKRFGAANTRDSQCDVSGIQSDVKVNVRRRLCFASLSKLSAIIARCGDCRKLASLHEFYERFCN